MRKAILVPETAMPKKDPENPCPCRDMPVKLVYKTGILAWLKEVGETVEKAEAVCEGEIEKMTLEFLSPVTGYLEEKCVEDEGKFAFGDVLGYIETEAPRQYE